MMVQKGIYSYIPSQLAFCGACYRIASVVSSASIYIKMHYVHETIIMMPDILSYDLHVHISVKCTELLSTVN